MSPKTTTLTSFFDPEFEEKFEQLQRDQRPLMEVLGKQHGLQDKPKSRQEYAVLILNNLKSSVQNVLEFNNSRFQPTTDVASIQDLRILCQDKIQKKIIEDNEYKKKEALIQEEQKDLKRKLNKKISSRLRIIIPTLFGICEGAVTYNMLESSSMPTTVSFFLALLTALAAGFGTYFAADYINKAQTGLRRKVRYIIVLTTGFTVAAALGVWRGTSYGNIAELNSQIELTNSHTSPFSPWPFIVVSFVAFIVALCFELMFWMNEAEQKLLVKYNDNKKEIKKVQEVITRLDDEIEKIKNDLSESSALSMRRLEYAKGNEYRLLSLASQLQNQYESTNIELRKDNSCPDFFGERINGFQTHFISLFQKI